MATKKTTGGMTGKAEVSSRAGKVRGTTPATTGARFDAAVRQARSMAELPSDIRQAIEAAEKRRTR